MTDPDEATRRGPLRRAPPLDARRTLDIRAVVRRMMTSCRLKPLVVLLETSIVMRYLVPVTAVIMASVLTAGRPSVADTIHLKGQAGFIGEWAFTSTLEVVPTPGSEKRTGYAGSLTMRHVGLCSVTGPQEQTGRMTAAFLRGGRVKDLTLAYGTELCTYTGRLPEDSGSLMTCTGGVAVPIRIWVVP